ncbi:MAG: hypothetical protein WD603_01530 [Patescibacteria group bacterium]
MGIEAGDREGQRLVRKQQEREGRWEDPAVLRLIEKDQRRQMERRRKRKRAGFPPEPREKEGSKSEVILSSELVLAAILWWIFLVVGLTFIALVLVSIAGLSVERVGESVILVVNGILAAFGVRYLVSQS